jgi:hypothetical protein
VPVPTQEPVGSDGRILKPLIITGFEGGEEGEGAKYTPSGNQTILKNAIYMRRDPKIQVHLFYFI